MILAEPIDGRYSNGVDIEMISNIHSFQSAVEVPQRPYQDPGSGIRDVVPGQVKMTEGIVSPKGGGQVLASFVTETVVAQVQVGKRFVLPKCVRYHFGGFILQGTSCQIKKLQRGSWGGGRGSNAIGSLVDRGQNGHDRPTPFDAMALPERTSFCKVVLSRRPSASDRAPSTPILLHDKSSSVNLLPYCLFREWERTTAWSLPSPLEHRSTLVREACSEQTTPSTRDRNDDGGVSRRTSERSSVSTRVLHFRAGTRASSTSALVSDDPERANFAGNFTRRHPNPSTSSRTASLE